MNNTPSPEKNFSLVTFVTTITAGILAAVGIPGAAIAVFKPSFLAHPWLTITLLIIYEVVVFIVGRFALIWGLLEKRWTERAVDWLDARFQEAFSETYQKYCEHLRYQHRFQEFSGMAIVGEYSLLLDQVFVELSIVSRAAHETSPSPVPILSLTSIEESHSIWYYLSSQSNEKTSLVIIGAPGSGKTTLLKHVALAFATHRRKLQREYHLPHELELPIFLFLRDYAEVVKNKPNFSLEEAVQDQCKGWEQDIPNGWIKQRLEQGRCLVMLDGLDEVTDDSTRRIVVRWVQKQINTYGKSRFIITSRPSGYRSNPLSGVDVLAVQPFSYAQVKRFIHNWCLAYEVTSKRLDDEGVRRGAKKEAEKLLRHLRDAPALLELSVNPLLLTMIATVHRYRNTLPASRVELYKEVCEVFLAKRQVARGIKVELNASQQLLVLQPLAYYLMDKRKQTINLDEARRVIDLQGYLKRVNSQMTPEEFLSLVEKRSGLLLEQKSGVYGFAHKTFQEYLAATYIKDNLWEQALINHIQDESWHETIRFYCAQTDASRIVNACLTNALPSAAILTLAIDCSEERLSIDKAVEAQLYTTLNRDVESADPVRRSVVAEALLSRRLRQMASLNDEVSIDSSLIDCAQYQLFIDTQEQRYYQPYHWNTLQFLSGQGKRPVLGVLRTDAEAFCKWLTSRDRSGVWTYRLPRLDEIEVASNEQILESSQVAGCWLTEETSENRLQDTLLTLKAADRGIRGTLFAPKTAVSEQPNLSLIFDTVLSHLFDFRSTYQRSQQTIPLRLKDSITEHTSELSNDFEHARTRTLIVAEIIDAVKYSSDYIEFKTWLDPKLDIRQVNYPDVNTVVASVQAFANELHSSFFQLPRTPAYARTADYLGTFAEILVVASHAASFPKLELFDNFQFINALLSIFDRSFPLAALYVQDAGKRRLAELCGIVCLLAKSTAIAVIVQREKVSYPQKSLWSKLRSFFYLPSGGEQKKIRAFQDVIAVYLNIYVAFALLQIRIQGTFPPCEGILLVKERRKQSDWEEISLDLMP